jgi:membrane associated rhomboid family serine protease
MIPLHDDVPTARRPWVTYGLIGTCVLVYLWEIGRTDRELAEVFYTLGFVPALLLGEVELAPGTAAVHSAVALVTSMFLHGGFLHLAGNMLYLWIFGNNVEDAMGRSRFLAFYLLCGISAALAQGVQDPSSMVPMVGASGAIGGVLGAYLLLHPHARVLALVPLGIIFFTVRIPAYVVLGLWFVFQLIAGGAAGGAEGGVAYWAHIGGFAAGMVLLFVFKRAGVPIWDSGRTGSPRQPTFTRRQGPWG